MKKLNKILALLVIGIMFVFTATVNASNYISNVYPISSVKTAAAHESFRPRFTEPKESNVYYSSSYSNPFVAVGLGMFQCNGNCTAYAFGRVSEQFEDSSISKKFMPTGNACDWYWDSSVPNIRRSQKPALGAVLCLNSNYYSEYGHVAVVEDLNFVNGDTKLICSESSYNDRVWYMHTYSLNELKRNNQIDGFIIIRNYQKMFFRTTIPYTTERRANPNLEKGKELVVREGVNGKQEAWYECLYKLGERDYRFDNVVSKKTITTPKIVKKPVSKIVEYGTK